MPEQDPVANMAHDARLGMNVVTFAIRSWASAMEVFLHRDVGERYPGAPGAGVLLLVPLALCCSRGHDPVPLVMFLFAFLGMCACHRVATLWRWLRGSLVQHSFYNGTPWLCSLLPHLSERAVKVAIEPVAVLVVGGMVALWNAPLGCFLIGGATCMFLSYVIGMHVLRQQSIDMRDAMIEQQMLAERVRRQHEGR